MIHDTQQKNPDDKREINHPNPQPTGGSSRGGKPLDSRSGKAATCALKIYPQKKRSEFCRNIQKHIVTEINVNLLPPIPPRGSSRGESPSKRQSPFNILAKLQSNFAVISKGASPQKGGFTVAPFGISASRNRQSPPNCPTLSGFGYVQTVALD